MKWAALAVVALVPGVSAGLAWGYTTASPITDGCHESLTAAALRQVRLDLGTPPLAPSADDQALIDDLPFAPPSDLRDLAGVSLLLGVRDNDLKGNDFSNAYDLIQIHGDPAKQREHCLRAAADDEPTGSAQALASCRAYIHDTALAALDGLGADGQPDGGVVTALTVWLAIRGRVDATLPAFYVAAGQAMHAVQDAFTHSFRTDDGATVTVVLNWVEFADEDLDERRDGPAHLLELDACTHIDEMRARRLALAQQASIDLLHALLDPGTAADKAAAVDGVLDRVLGYQQGCTFDNHWCDAPEQALASDGGCGCAVGDASGGGLAALAFAVAVALGRPRRGRAAVLLLALALPAGRARADAPDAADAPLTAAELGELRDLRSSGPRYGLAAMVGGSLDRSAVMGSIGGRYRLSEHWLAGADVEWNPWIATYPLGTRWGVLNVYGTLIRRYPMRFERVSLRTTLRAGASFLLFDLYGAREGSVGPYLGIAPLGIDVQIGRGWKLVFDPLSLEIPVPHVTGVPLYYEQFRLSFGLQYGA